MAVNKRGLGKGLDTMIPPVKNEKKSEKGDPAKGPETLVNITKVEPNREQPRKNFDEDALLELSESIKQYGLLQPILVQDRKDYYEIIAGERRWRAAKLAGLKQDEVAERVSKSRTAVTNSMRLLKLSDDVQRMVIDEMITTGHARALLGVEDPAEQYNLAQRIFDEKLSVREVEKIVKNMGKPVKPKKEKVVDKSMQVIYDDISEKLKTQLGTKVNIVPKEDGSGKIEIEFYSHDELDRILDLMK